MHYRFRPVLMTTTVATVGMIPAAIATGVDSDVQRGLATVIVGGLIVATILTLFINTLAILNAQTTYLQASITRVQALTNRYADTALFQALGGGWWNRMDIPAQETFDIFDVLRFTAPPPKQ